MPINGKRKGKVGELEWAAFLREHGYDEARRGVQYSGGGDSPDVVGLPGVHIEVKRTERLSLYDAVDQSRRDCGAGNVPIVVHRCNNDGRKNSCRGDWLVILSADDFLNLLGKAHGDNDESCGVYGS